MDELRRRQRRYVRDDRPRAVVEIENRMNRDEIHVRVVVGVECSDVPPVALIAIRCTGHLVVREVPDPVGGDGFDGVTAGDLVDRGAGHGRLEAVDHGKGLAHLATGRLDRGGCRRLLADQGLDDDRDGRSRCPVDPRIDLGRRVGRWRRVSRRGFSTEFPDHPPGDRGDGHGRQYEGHP